MSKTITDQQARDALATLGKHADKPLQHAVGLKLDDIRKVWRQLARTYHPDRNRTKQAAEIFRDCNAAVTVIEQYVEQTGSMPDPRKRSAPEPKAKPKRSKPGRRSVRRPSETPQRAEAPMGGFDPVEHRRRQEVLRQAAQSSYSRVVPGSTMPPFGAQSAPTYGQHTTVQGQPQAPYGRQYHHAPGAAQPTYGQESRIVQGLESAAQIFTAFQQGQTNGAGSFVSHLADMLGDLFQGNAQANVQAEPARFYVRHEELARYTNLARQGASSVILQGTLQQPGTGSQQGAFSVQLQDGRAIVNGVPCTIHVQ